MNILIIAIITAISFLYVSPVSCMNRGEIELIKHVNCCHKIFEYNQQKLKDYKNNSTQHDHQQSIIFIKDKFEKYAKNLFAEQEKILCLIQQKYTIEPGAWDSCMKLIKEITKFNKNNHYISLPNIYHDPAIPADILELITETLRCYKINPLTINIVSEHTNKNDFYTLKIPTPIIDKAFLEIKSPPQGKPGRIIIHLRSFLQLSTTSQTALCMLMAEEIVQNAQLIPIVLAMKQEELINQGDLIESLIENLEFKKLCSLCYDQLPFILLSIRSLETASYIVHLETYNRLTGIHDQYFYRKLCKIYSYWQTLEWINEQQKTDV